MTDRQTDIDRNSSTPLAERMRPRSIEDFYGQDEALALGSSFQTLLQANDPMSCIFWGPPGSGKTTLARIIATRTRLPQSSYSSVTTSISEVKKLMAEASDRKNRSGIPTLLFIDEIHRFNKAQQDAFLPHLESGAIILLGTTTENPSFHCNKALLSRMQIVVLKPLLPRYLKNLIARTLKRDTIINKTSFSLDDKVIERIANSVEGDARKALSIVEVLFKTYPDSIVTITEADATLSGHAFKYDRQEDHYDIISALHKSMRNSDVDASLYWLARMLESGEDPLYIVRRMIRFASEDIGNADPEALHLAISVKDAVHFLGMPECNNAMAQLAIYLATAPKSNSVYLAYQEVKHDLLQGEIHPVPYHLRNAPTPLMAEIGYAKNYRYAHDNELGIVAMSCLPLELENRQYYKGKPTGFEKMIIKRQQYWQGRKKKDDRD